MRILLVEDDDDLRRGVTDALLAEEFAVDAVTDAPEADEAVAVNEYDCLVLDRMVPSGDLVDFVAEHRGAGLATPVLFLTARDGIADRVDGFEAGGDDYLVKPFALEELIVRVRALCRRRDVTQAPIVTVGPFTIDRARAEVRRDGVLLPLTAKERCLLLRLASADGSVVTRSELIEHCWDEHHDPMSNVVDVHMGRLRRKLGEPSSVRTVRGEGFVLDAT